MSIAQNPATQCGQIHDPKETNMDESPAAAHGDSTSDAYPSQPEHAFDVRPNRVADAAELLVRFSKHAGGQIVSRGGHQLDDNDRTTVIAAQLLACASQLERIGDILELMITAPMGAGKSHTVGWFLDAWNKARDGEVQP
jgi:hypothetical protein